VEKYADLAMDLTRAGWAVRLDAFIVGALGSWDPDNGPVLKSLGISARYSGLMSRLMVSDTIHWSRDVYVEHLSDFRQYV
jgi:hypothetical protein